jgi:hypothetical protein
MSTAAVEDDRLARCVRFAFLTAAWLVALGAGLAPLVYLLRRLGVG